MKRIHIVGLCLVAVFAFSAMVASTASAAEYGICTGVSLTTGKALKNQEWKDANCTQKESVSDPDGKFAWVPGKPPICVGGAEKNKDHASSACGAGEEKVSDPDGKFEAYCGNEPPVGSPPSFGAANKTCDNYTSKTGKALLSTPGLGASEVECTGGTGHGEITGAKTGVTTTTFTGCSTAKKSSTCTSEQLRSPSGTIETYPLNTTLVGNPEKNKNGGPGPISGEVWTRFTGLAPHEKYLAIFRCVGVAWFSAQGWNAGFQRENVGKMSTTSKTEIHEGTGEQFQVTEVCENNEFEPGPCKHGQAGPSPSLQEVAGAEATGVVASEIKA
jgi:hypothetical protein